MTAETVSLAFATSAIRSANNGSAFVKEASEKTGIDITVISGEKEAELIYFGVRQCISLEVQPVLIMDIGGGSTEFIIANGNKIFWKHSFNIGAARLLEMFKPSDPILPGEIKKLESFLTKELSILIEAVEKFNPDQLIGSSGSFDSLAEIVAHKFYSPDILDNKTEFTFNLDDCAIVYESILKSTNAERLQMKGLVAMRVDMIVISSILVHFIIASLDIQKMRLSTYSLKEGVLYGVMNKEL